MEKVMKKFRIILLSLILLPCFLFSGCSLFKEKHIVNIVKTSDYVYTVTYSDGSTSTLETSGKDGEDLTMDNLYKYWDENNNGETFEEFLKNNFSIDSELTSSAATKASKSAVSIVSLFETTDSILTGGGAGIIYKKSSTHSYIITNYHVVYYKLANTSNKIANDIFLFQYGMEQVTNNSIYTEGIPCEYIGGSLNYDIAILKVKNSDLNEYATPVDIADGYELAETAIAIGNPNNKGISVTSGVISVISEDIQMKGADETTTCQFRVLRIDTAINGGNSGGGLFNQHGQLIGIVNAKYVDEEIDNIAYALPFDNVSKVADNIIYNYEKNNTISQVNTLLFNVYYDAVNSKAVYNGDHVKIVEDLEIREVTADGLGDRLGLQTNDIVKGVTISRNNEPTYYEFERAYELKELCLTIKEGDIISIKYSRSGQIKETSNHTVVSADFSIIG